MKFLAKDKSWKIYLSQRYIFVPDVWTEINM